MLCVVMMSVVMLNVVMLSIVAQRKPMAKMIDDILLNKKFIKSLTISNVSHFLPSLGDC
jgi:hypothetical protein